MPTPSPAPNAPDQSTDPNDPTAGYRPKPKGPNFLGIVILSGIVILLILFATVLFLKKDAGKMNPVKRNQTPNSLVLRPSTISNA